MGGGGGGGRGAGGSCPLPIFLSTPTELIFTYNPSKMNIATYIYYLDTRNFFGHGPISVTQTTFTSKWKKM